MKWSDVILYTICVATLIVAGYDLVHLKNIEAEVLDSCNVHWENEFKDKCTLSTELDYGFKPLNLSNIMFEQDGANLVD